MTRRIQSKGDYIWFVKADMTARGVNKWANPFVNDVWKFQRTLRKLEFHLNCRNGLLWRPVTFLLRRRFQNLSVRYGFSIPPNVFGAGLHIPHRGDIIVSPFARVGENCRIHAGASIGNEANEPGEAPIIGDNVYIGPGVKIFGRIVISDGIAIGANSVVNKDFREPDITIAGIPARKTSNKGSSGMQIRATLLLRK